MLRACDMSWESSCEWKILLRLYKCKTLQNVVWVCKMLYNGLTTQRMTQGHNNYRIWILNMIKSQRRPEGTSNLHATNARHRAMCKTAHKTGSQSVLKQLQANQLWKPHNSYVHSHMLHEGSHLFYVIKWSRQVASEFLTCLKFRDNILQSFLSHCIARPLVRLLYNVFELSRVLHVYLRS